MNGTWVSSTLSSLPKFDTHTLKGHMTDRLEKILFAFENRSSISTLTLLLASLKLLINQAEFKIHGQILLLHCF